MTENSPAPSTATPESFPEFDAPAFTPPAPSPVLDPSAPKAKAPEAVKVADGAAGAPTKDAAAVETPAGPAAEAEAAADDAAEPAPGPFAFAGRTFKDADAAAHYLKTQEGRAKSEAKRNADLKAETERLKAEAAQSQRAAEYYKAEAEKKATPPQETKPAETAKPKSWLEDQKLWTDVRNLAETEGIDAAMYHALQQADGHLSKAYEARLEAELAPFKHKEKVEKLNEHVLGLFDAAEKFTDAAGTPVYPELSEGKETNAAIARIWATLEPSFALTEQGLDYAILRFRAQRAGNPPPKAPAPSGAAAPTAETLAAAANPAPEPLNGGGVPRPASADGAAARSRRVLGGDQRPRVSTSGESLGFID